jgi:FAD/FMN-containing dehydrogenase
MMQQDNLSNAAKETQRRFSGLILQPADEGYEEARKVHNGLIDKRPAAIARCSNTPDIIEAVRLARDAGLEVAIRGGGHNVSGRATVDGGLMIDLSLMRVVDVDPNTQTAVAQSGATWADFNQATQEYGLATPGGFVSTTGIAGLTLGGGFGWITSKYGLAVDNLISVDMVMADGERLTASETENEDLFWALRGAGANFGVATSFTFRLHPVGPTVIGGFVAHPMDRAGELLRFYRDLMANLPDDETAIAGMMHAPDGSGTKLAVVAISSFGQEGENSQAVRKVKGFGTPLMDTIGPIGYCDLNMLLDGAFPRGALNYWKSNFLAQLSDKAIDTMVEAFAACPAPLGQVLIEHFHGAVTRVPVADTAVPLRNEAFNFLALSQWLDPNDNETCIAWARDAYSAMKPFMGENRYVNYLGADESTDASANAYGSNYERLRKVKSKYDPQNFFHLNQNIVPA